MSTTIRQSSQIRSTSSVLLETDPVSFISNPVTLDDDLNNIRHILKYITKQEHWYDEGDIIAIVDESIIDHDLLKNFVADEHINWTNTNRKIQTTGDVQANRFLGSSFVIGSGASTLSGSLAISGSITVPTPTASGNATTKAYVDSLAVDTYRAGVIAISNQDTVSVTYSSALPDTNYALSATLIGADIFPFVVTTKTVDGFSVSFSGTIPASGYSLEYSTRQHR